MDVIKLDELEFVKLIDQKEIAKRINVLASQLTSHLANKNPYFLVVMNGAFVFAADLLRQIKFPCDIGFVDAKSYDGMDSSGEVKVNDGGLNVKEREVVVIEDIVDTGHTINILEKICTANGANSVQVCSFLSKPEASKYDATVDFVGFEIAKQFVIGYGLDYNGKGRNLPHIYQIRPFV